MGANIKAWAGGFKRAIGDESLGPTLALALDNTTKQIHICDIEDVGTDWGKSNDSYPTVYIHDITNPITDYLRLYHNGTNGIIDCDGTTVLSLTASALTVTPATAFTTKATFGTTGARQSYSTTGDIAVQIATDFTLAGAGGHGGCNVYARYSPSTTGIATVGALYGETELATGKTANGSSTQRLFGVAGFAKMTGTVNGAAVIVSGVEGWVGPASPTALTAFESISCFTAVSLFQTDPLAGYYSGFLVSNAGGYRYDYGFLALEACRYGLGIRPNKADSTLESAIIVDATNVSMAYNVIELVDTTSINYFLKTGTAGGCVATNTSNLGSDTCIAVISVNFDGTPGYIPVLAAVPSG